MFFPLSLNRIRIRTSRQKKSFIIVVLLKQMVMVTESVSLLIVVVYLLQIVADCGEGIFNSFIRTLVHGDSAHLIFNLLSFSNVSQMLNSVVMRSHYILVLMLIWMLDVIVDAILTHYKLKWCAVGFSGVIFGLITYLYLYAKIDPVEMFKSIALLLLPGLIYPNISNVGHIVGIFNGALVYILLNWTNVTSATLTPLAG